MGDREKGGGGGGGAVQIQLSFSSRERETEREICFLVSMATSAYYEGIRLERGRKRKRERIDGEVRPPVYLWEQRAMCGVKCTEVKPNK